MFNDNIYAFVSDITTEMFAEDNLSDRDPCDNNKAQKHPQTRRFFWINFIEVNIITYTKQSISSYLCINIVKSLILFYLHPTYYVWDLI